MQIYKYFTPLVKHNIILLIFYFCNTGSINDGCTNAVATAMTPSIDTTTRPDLPNTNENTLDPRKDSPDDTHPIALPQRDNRRV